MGVVQVVTIDRWARKWVRSGISFEWDNLGVALRQFLAHLVVYRLFSLLC